uniref:Uncharacterized protein n=1 Tax=Myoviridae sp. ctBtT5 TaxID=2825048 RepID=A0A8S5PZ03_9CAUD|nr:MAG TPA: hypothetical protein [Myoviridae sp. ctBtT5]
MQGKIQRILSIIEGNKGKLFTVHEIVISQEMDTLRMSIFIMKLFSLKEERRAILDIPNMSFLNKSLSISKEMLGDFLKQTVDEKPLFIEP